MLRLKWVTVFVVFGLISPLYAVTKPKKETGSTNRFESAPKRPTQEQTPSLTFDQQKSVSIPGSPRSKGEIEQFLRGYLLSNPNVFGAVHVGQFRTDYVQEVRGTAGLADMLYVRFAQTSGDTDVEGGEAVFSVKKFSGSTNVVRAQGRFYQSVQTAPQGLNRSDAEAKAREKLASQNVKTDTTYIQTKIRFIDGHWRKLDEFSQSTDGLRAAVDLATGETYLWDNKVYADVTGTATGRVVAFDPLATGDNLTTAQLSNLRVSISSGPFADTNSVGYFAILNAGTSPVGISTELSGKWVNVNDLNASDLRFNSTATPGTPIDFLFNPSGNFELYTSQTNAYYHVNAVHNWVASRGVSPAGIDIAIPTSVNANDVCNAYYSPGSSALTFFRSGGGCLNSAYDTVVYHEYGHFVDDAAGGISFADGITEGWGDVLAVYMSGQPLIAEGFYGTPGSKIRTADNSYVYVATDEIHTNGQAWAGFAWHLRQNLISSLGTSAGVALAETLVVPVFLANPVDIPNAVREVAIRDDNDGNLSNGTPHFAQIQAAANQHGLGYAVQPDSTPPTVQITAPANQANVSGSVSVAATATDNVKVTKVEFLVDGGSRSVDTTSPYSYLLDSCSLTAGDHTLSAKAYDFVGLTTTHSITINVLAGGSSSPSIVSPSNNSTVTGSATITASVSSCTAPQKVEIFIDGAVNGLVTSNPYSWNWDTSAASNGSHTLVARSYFSGGSYDSSPITVNVSNATSTKGALFSSTLLAPTCSAVGSNCDSGSLLLNGRGDSGGKEVNRPNTIYSSCLDGNLGSYHYDESIDRVKVSTVGGGTLMAGSSVRVDVTVWAFSAAADFLDLYYAADATNPNWTYFTTVSPTAAGATTLSATYTLPSGTLQAVRARFRYYGATSPCGTGNYDDHDDLVFAVGTTPPADTTPPSVSITSPTEGSTVTGTVTVAANASDNVSVSKVEFYKDGAFVTADTAAPYTFAWNTLSESNGAHSLAAKAYDTSNLTSQTTVNVQVNNANRNPTVTLFANPTTGKSPLTVNFTANGSDPDGDSLTYNWTFGDGTVQNDGGRSLYHVYVKGTYSACVTALDGRGGSARTCTTITVTGKPGTNVTIHSYTGTALDCEMTIEFQAVEVEDGSPVQVSTESPSIFSLTLNGANASGAICLNDGKRYDVCAYLSGKSMECWSAIGTKDGVDLVDGNPDTFFVNSFEPEGSSFGGSGCGTANGSVNLFYLFAMSGLAYFFRKRRAPEVNS
jgi:hypothetical protein